jgi:hypothetical protein
MEPLFRNRALAACVALACLGTCTAAAQSGRVPAARKPASPAPAPALRVDPAVMMCPSPVGTGVASKREFCDVPIGRTPSDGITIKLPAYTGTAALLFDLHNRQTYSEEQVRARKAYTLATATIGVLTLDNTLIARAVVQNEFRTVTDLFDRIGGGAGPGGLKAVAPSGVESVRIVLPEATTEVCILGEKLAVQRFDIDESFSAPGRPIALISNVMVEYQPVPAKKPPAKKPVTKRPAKKRTTARS